MTVKIQNASEITNAQGMPRNRNAKPVICLDTGEVFASARDAAESAGAHPSTMSWALTERQNTCKGKRYCYLSKVTEHLDELTTNIQAMSEKAKKYDELVARKDEMPKPEPTQTYTKANVKPRSFGRKIIDMFAKRNIRTAI
jgi:hypothetical protein